MEPVLAAIMAGGRSERMRATNGATHKALVEVGGVTMLERNVRRLLKRGIKEIVVVSSPAEPRIADAIENEQIGRAHV